MMNRRTFLKLCGLAAYGLGFGFGTTGCATFPKDVIWSDVPDSEFTIQRFDDWFEKHKLYNGLNPNLKWGHAGHSPSFKGCISRGYSPGIDYNSNYLYAAADGIVSSIHEIGETGRPRGWVVTLAHGSHIHGVTYKTLYCHLDKGGINAKMDDWVHAGDKIGSVMQSDIAKLILMKRFNYVDPDNYGVNHSYQNYLLSKIVNENIEDKNLRQLQIIGEISNRCIIELDLLRKHTTLSKYYVMQGCVWDQIEMFRYLSELYNARPRLFQNLPHEKFAEYKSEFYASQPIVLSLPLKA